MTYDDPLDAPVFAASDIWPAAAGAIVLLVFFLGVIGWNLRPSMDMGAHCACHAQHGFCTCGRK